MLVTYLRFDPLQDLLDGNGWVLTSYDEDTPTVAPVVTNHATITAAQAAARDLFIADTSIDAHFQDRAEADYLAANGAAVGTAHLSQRTQEYLAQGVVLGAGPGYLVPTVGTATTPNFLLPNEFTLVFKVKGPNGAGAAAQTIASMYEADGTRSWLLRRNETTGDMFFTVAPFGTVTGAATRSIVSQAITPGVTELLAFSVTLSAAGTQHLKTWRSTNNGLSWFLLASTSPGPAIIPHPGRWVDLPGSASNNLSVPDSAALDITGDICIVARVAADDWTPTSVQTIIAKNDNGNNRSYGLNLDIAGTLTAFWSPDGTVGTQLTRTSTANLSALANGAWKWIAYTVDVVNGSGVNHDVRFWTSDDGVTWTQLGSTVTGGTATSLFAGTSPLYVSGVAGSIQPFAGNVSHVSIRNGIGAAGVVGGTEVFGFSPTNVPDDVAASSFVAATGQTVTINKSGGPVATVVRPIQRIGSFATSDVWDDNIYWVEMRTGLDPAAGTLMWRFDPADHSSGTTWTDPRGHAWTLTAANALVHDGRQ